MKYVDDNTEIINYIVLNAETISMQGQGLKQNKIIWAESYIAKLKFVSDMGKSLWFVRVSIYC